MPLLQPPKEDKDDTTTRFIGVPDNLKYENIDHSLLNDTVRNILDNISFKQTLKLTINGNIFYLFKGNYEEFQRLNTNCSPITIEIEDIE